MTPGSRSIGSLAADEGGQTSIEWALLLGGFVLPMGYVLALLLDMLVAYYRMVSFLETLPFP